MAMTPIGVPAHRLLSSVMRRALLTLALDDRAFIAHSTLQDLLYAKLVRLDRSGRPVLTRAGLRIAEDLEADRG